MEYLAEVFFFKPPELLVTSQRTEFQSYVLRSKCKYFIHLLYPLPPALRGSFKLHIWGQGRVTPWTLHTERLQARD